MTLAVRNSVLIVGVILSLLVLSAYAVGVWTLFVGPLSDAPITIGEHQQWLGMRWRVNPIAAYHSLGAAGIMAVVAITGLLAAIRVFRRVSSAEIYFITLFLVSLALEPVRLARPLAELAGMPLSVGVQLTRVVLFGRLFGGLSLFVAAIYAAGADYPRIGSVTLLLCALCALIVYLVPVDSGRMAASFLHVTGGRDTVDLMLGFLSVGTIVNYAVGWGRGMREQAGALALSVIAMTVGKELVLHVALIFPLALGLALVAGGLAAFVIVNRSRYLWY